MPLLSFCTLNSYHASTHHRTQRTACWQTLRARLITLTASLCLVGAVTTATAQTTTAQTTTAQTSTLQTTSESAQTNMPPTASSTAQIAPSASAQLSSLQPFTADYVVLREGKAHGTAQRFLQATAQGYELGYRSKISWLVFDDDRQEQSLLQIEQGQVRPYRYQMQREGSGPDRRYVVQLNRATQQILQEKNKVLTTPWRDDYQDMLSFMLQLTLDLQRGQTDFHYHVLNRHGEVREYRYKVTGEELLSLPYGQIKAIRIERYGQSPDKQVIAWVAPSLQYNLVRLWQSEENVEQFDVQLKQHSLTTTTTK